MKVEITSLQNSHVKRVVKLQRKATVRHTEGLTVVEGMREVTRAIENGWQPVELWFGPNFGKLEEEVFHLLKDKYEHPFHCFHCLESVFSKISYRKNSSGVLAVGPLVGRRLNELRLSEDPLILVSEGIEKPGNLGALLRVADGAGADAVIVCDPATDLNNPNVIRASIGTLFYLPVAEASAEATIAFLKEKKIRILSAVPNAEFLYSQLHLTGPLAIVVGAEDHGLSKSWKNSNDLEVRIPMLGKNDSLNVSVSSAILLYEAVRQRKSPIF